MGRPAYKITQADFGAAMKYLKRKYGVAYPTILYKVETAEQLQQWCENVLHPEQWKQLKATILQERKRGRDEAQRRKLKTINLEERAWKELNTLQRNLKEAGFDVTYSELVKALAEKFNGTDAKTAARDMEIQI